MHVFIDTSVVYTDPFWKRNFASQLLEAASNNLLKIYLSEVVIKELRSGFIKQMEKEINSIKSSRSKLDKLLAKEIRIELPKVDSLSNEFDEFYATLKKKKNIIIINTANISFEKILEKAISKTKPFGENKSEFKDAVIWESYSEFCLRKKLKDCFFLTTNVTDFYDDDKVSLHKDLKKDFDFILYKSMEDFYTDQSEAINKPIKDFQKWLSNQSLDNKSIFEILFDNYTDTVFDEIHNHFDRIDPSRYDDSSDYISLLGGYSEVKEVIWIACNDINISTNLDYVIISGKLDTQVTLDLYGYNSFRDQEDEKYPYCGEKVFEVELNFNFIYDKEETPENFEITHIDYDLY